LATRIVGIDFGSRALRGVEVEGALRDRPTLRRYFEVPIPAGVVRSGEVIDLAAASAAIRRLWSGGKFSTKNVVLGVGNQRVLARDIELPRMTQAQLRESLQYHVQDKLPMPINEAVLDFFPISEGTGEGGPVMNGLLVAASKEAVLANVNAVVKAGLKPVEVDLIPFAVTRTQLRGLRGDGVIALIDVGAETTTVVVTDNGVPQFVRMIPAGGSDVTRGIMSRLSLGEEAADGTKVRMGLVAFGGGTPDQQLAMEAITSVTGELLESIRNTITYYDNTHAAARVDRIVLSGGGARLEGFAAALRELARTNIVVVDPLQTLNVARALRTMGAAERDSLTVALGLALGSKN